MWNNETKWLLVALASFLLIFERQSGIKVQNNEVTVVKTTFWFNKREIKKTSASNIRDARTWCGGVRGGNCWLAIYTKDGALFFELPYSSHGAAHEAMNSFKSAIKTGGEFSGFADGLTSLFGIAGIVVSFLMFFYRRGLRLENLKQSLCNDSKSGTQVPFQHGAAVKRSPYSHSKSIVTPHLSKRKISLSIRGVCKVGKKRLRFPMKSGGYVVSMKTDKRT